MIFWLLSHLTSSKLPLIPPFPEAPGSWDGGGNCGAGGSQLFFGWLSLVSLPTLRKKLQVCSRWAPRKQTNLFWSLNMPVCYPLEFPLWEEQLGFFLLLGFWLTGNSVFCITEIPIILMGLRGKIGCKINRGSSLEILCIQVGTNYHGQFGCLQPQSPDYGRKQRINSVYLVQYQTQAS